MSGPILARKSTRRSSRATYACRRRPPTGSRRCSTTSDAPAARRICASPAKSSSVSAPFVRLEREEIPTLALEQRRRLGRGLDALLGAYPAEPDEHAAAAAG